MTIIGLIIALVIVGLVLWLINTFIPMQPQVKTILNVLVIILLVLWILQALLGFTFLNTPVRIR